MPGALHSRGCDACRAHKKKCDLQRPTCARCQKARIPCVGAKEIRYKFIDGNKWASSSALEHPPESLQITHSPFSLTPSNESSLLSQGLVARLRPKDLRYSIPQLWGRFMIALPRRIGHNAALDAASATILELHHALSRSVFDDASVRSIVQKYGRAISALRSVLEDPIKARETETLCAIMLALKCASYVEGPINNYKSAHGNGAAELLKLRGFVQDRDPFEAMLYTELRFQVALQTLFDQNTRLSQEQWKEFEYSCPTDHPSGRLLLCLVRIGRFMTDARCTVRGSVEELAAYFKATQFQQEVERLTQELQNEVANHDSHKGDPWTATEKLARKQKLYNQGLAIAAALLCVRRALGPEDVNLGDEMSLLCSRTYQLAEEARAYLPLGANWMPVGLMIVWCATKGTGYHSGIERLMDRWMKDTLSNEEAEMPRPNLDDMYQQLSLGDRRGMSNSDLLVT